MNVRSKKGGIETRLLHMFSDQCTKLHFDKILFTDHLEIKPVHRGWIYQFFVCLIHYSGYIASTVWKLGTNIAHVKLRRWQVSGNLLLILIHNNLMFVIGKNCHRKRYNENASKCNGAVLQAVVWWKRNHSNYFPFGPPNDPTPKSTYLVGPFASRFYELGPLSLFY